MTAESFAERAHTLPYVHHSAATQGWKLNFVRGEDSLVRAIWAAKPFIWQIYPQHVGMHLAKLDTFLTMMDAPESLKIVHQLSNSSANEAISPDLELGIWTKSAQNLSKKLRLQVNLASSLIAFVEKNSYNNGLTSKSYRKAIKILPKY